MAHMIESTDGLVLAGEKAWHGLGIVLPQRPTVQEAVEVAKLGWRVETCPLTAHGVGSLDGENVPADGWRAIVRADTRTVFGCATDGYTAVQNGELAQFALDLAGSADAKVETAGSLRGGRDVFFLLPTGEIRVGAKGADVVKRYALLHASHDTSGSVNLIATDIRTVCANTLVQGLAGGGGFRSKHTANVHARMSDAVASFRRIVEGGHKRAEAVQALAARPLTADERRDFFLAVYTASIGRIPSKVETEADRTARDRATDTVSAWLANLDDPRQRIDGIGGTAWAAFNAVTQWSDHERRTRRTDGLPTETEARQFSGLFGQGADLKREAWSKALELVAVR